MKKDKLYKGIFICFTIIIASIFLIKPVFNKINFGLDLKGGFEVLYLVESLEKNENVKDDDVKSTYKAIRNRIDTLGVSEPEISIEGNKIRVKLPGVTDEDEARKRLSTPAVLTFRNTSDEELMTGSILNTPGASLDYDRTTNKPVVALSIKDKDTFYRVTKNISESSDQLITIWLDFEEGDSYQNTTCGETGNTKCISSATVKEGFMDNVIIQGNFTESEANELIDLINSGSLPTKLTEVSTKTVDASFGQGTLEKVAIAGIITLIIIVLLMTYFYRISGAISGICLILYTMLVFIIFNGIDGVLTLTGIAALILGIGMGIDSSIITLEKIKEELSNGKSLLNAYKEGNKRSLISLIDANITTFIVAIVLFIFGESSVKGFATMLILTIVVTFITMIFANRIIMNLIVKSNVFDKKENLLFGKIKKEKSRNYLKISKYNITLICFIIVLGLIFGIINKPNLGIDFKGGSTITIKSEENINTSEINEILKEYNIVEKETDNIVSYYKIEETLNEKEIKELKSSLEEKNYLVDISVISNIVKKDLVKNAIKSLIIASIGVLIYIGIRFTSRFAMSSIIAILSDIAVTISIFMIFKFEINFIFIAGILTIIGYSINDTIVVFDMIRDKLKNVKTLNEETIKETVIKSMSLSLKRNILTSITTLTAIVTLLIMKTSGITEFNITVLIGLLAGTFSSLFVAPYIWIKLEVHRLKNPKKEDDEDEIVERRIKGINS